MNEINLIGATNPQKVLQSDDTCAALELNFAGSNLLHSAINQLCEARGMSLLPRRGRRECDRATGATIDVLIQAQRDLSRERRLLLEGGAR